MSIIDEIKSSLAEIERSENVRIIYACESGSRAWGFPSADSDYDVRFIYVRTHDWYLSIDFERKRDVIERPINGDLDVNGWDLPKALRLLRKSNPALVEWLGSPIVYHDMPAISGAIRSHIPHFYSPRNATHHYYSIAHNQHVKYLRRELINPKKYLYVLRALLAVRWIEEERGIVPTEFDTLVEGLLRPGPLGDAIDALIERKRSGEELALEPHTPLIRDYIDAEIARLEGALPRFQEPDGRTEQLDELFRWTIEEVGKTANILA
jgi:predicted nucleotidyltransferase